MTIHPTHNPQGEARIPRRCASRLVLTLLAALCVALFATAISNNTSTHQLNIATPPVDLLRESGYHHDIDILFDPYNRPFILLNGDTLHIDFLPDMRHGPLTELDYIEVADRLGVEVPAIKAVVDIEAGRQHKGLQDSLPIINFDLSVFRQMAQRKGLSLSHYTRSHPAVFQRPNIRRYGSYQAAEHAILRQAMTIDTLTAIQSTFWGMFQIGGFNWKQCGASSPTEFVKLMSRSERDQLELFANFITNTGLLDALRRKDWRTFARGYNGPSYAAHGYHRRLADAYARHKK